MRTIVNHLWWCWHRLQIGFNHKCTILYCFSLWIIVTGDWFWTKWKQAIKLNYTQNTICKRASKVQNESVQKHENLRRKGPIWLEPVLWVLGGETLHHRQNSLTRRLKQIKLHQKQLNRHHKSRDVPYFSVENHSNNEIIKSNKPGKSRPWMHTRWLGSLE